MKTYEFRVVVAPDEDRWFACCPVLETGGAATWGYTREEAIKNIREVLQMTLDSMARHGEVIPPEPEEGALVWEESVAVNPPGGCVR